MALIKSIVRMGTVRKKDTMFGPVAKIVCKGGTNTNSIYGTIVYDAVQAMPITFWKIFIFSSSVIDTVIIHVKDLSRTWSNHPGTTHAHNNCFDHNLSMSLLRRGKHRHFFPSNAT